jgi:hypothetical protein
MKNDLIKTNLPWVTPWFCNPYSEEIDLDAIEREIADEISSRWESTDTLVLFDDLVGRFELETIAGVIDKVVAAHIRPEWEGNGRKQPSTTLDDFIRLMWGPLPEAGFTVEIEHQTDGIQIHCTRCPLADTGNNNGAAFWFYHLVCSGDPHAAAGFNPKIGFRRTQTLMQGHPCCDHFYFMKDTGK